MRDPHVAAASSRAFETLPTLGDTGKELNWVNDFLQKTYASLLIVGGVTNA